MSDLPSQFATRLIESLRKYSTKSDGWTYYIFGPRIPDDENNVDLADLDDFAYWELGKCPTREIYGVYFHQPSGSYDSTWFWDQNGRTICFPESSPTSWLGDSFTTYGIPTLYDTPEIAASVLCTGELPGA